MPALFRRPAGLLGGLDELVNWFVRARDYYFSLPRFKFEAMTFGLAVLCGLLVMPVLIFVAGHFTLREYANGGLFALYFDYFKSLFLIRESAWVVAVGPFLFLSLFRIFRLILRKVPAK
jgi:hypothetical protein